MSIVLDKAELAIVVPELFLALASLVLLMAGAFSKGQRAVRGTTVGALFAFAVTALFVVLLPYGDSGRVAFNGLIHVSAFTAFLKVLILLGSALALVLSTDFFEKEKIARFEYPVLVVLATVGMLLMVSASDLMTLYMGLEMQSLALYVIASIHRDNAKSTEAGLKYFVLGALSSGLLLYGISLVYGYGGSTNFTLLAPQLTDHPPTGVVIGLVFVIAALAFKVSAVPFHMWTPDVYEGAPTPVASFFAAAPKVAAMGLLVQVLTGPFGGMVAQWQQVIVFVSIASMVFGSVAAINQKNIKRLMAYSSIGHMGFTLVGLAAANADGILGVLVYLAVYVVMGLGTFACIIAMRVKGQAVENIDDLAGLSRTQPLVALALALFMFSMAGIPPLAGFFSKFYVFRAAVQADLFALAIIGVLASVVGAFYYLRVIKVMYFDQPSVTFDKMAPGVALVAGSTCLVTLLFWVYPSAVISTAARVSALVIGG
ncbi:NADH-quinone oxidoreductase subunit N [Elstera cyanobacteriorum]|uniref:NADH-quinone oxidoreductase subunit N n=1 Tax=Elstera cyanobacteriorum TaxID=2022747 RepID=A0A255XQA0_9PROT|nr:NADH-quinone oxidoreductase subunit NuoN [Elstera cyanobacteriorum]OYQ18534.1 NADH-quinone oxidoreductase subunit N [Elstera cyanobacteriorum]GFZ79593.1 NADH-quinone oxidoreductase subunit N [Elstera cyanobacteriorum]